LLQEVQARNTRRVEGETDRQILAIHVRRHQSPISQEDLGMDSQSNALVAMAHKVAKRDLMKIAKLGMEQHRHAMYDYCADDYEYRPADLGFLWGWLPRAVESPSNTCECASGFFEGKNLPEILRLCLTEDALALLLKQSCNEYLFWQNIDFLIDAVFRSDQPGLPFTVDYVHHRLVEYRWRDSGETVTAFQNLIRTKGDSFDPGQLDAAQAIDLLRRGILLLEPRGHLKTGGVVLNPVWKSLLAEEVKADSGDSHS
jgi:hypothetical protein